VMTDQEALRALAREQSEAAFEELFVRYRTMVYSACFRVSRDAAMAKDAAQGVFIALCRKASALPAGTNVGGWLHRAACMESLNRRRAAARRSANEQRAMEMNTIEEESLEDVWRKVGPEMDEALETLPEKLRDAVVLRYLEGKSREEAATELGCVVNTFDQRVSRGLEGLRSALRKKGVAVSSMALSTLLATRSVEAAPASGWPAAGKLLSGVGKGSAGALITKGTLIMLSIKKVAAVATLVAVAVAAGYGGLKAINKTVSKTGAAASPTVGAERHIGKTVVAKAGMGNVGMTANKARMKPKSGQDGTVMPMMRFLAATDDGTRFECLVDMGLPISREEFEGVLRRARERAHNPLFPNNLPRLEKDRGANSVLRDVLRFCLDNHPAESIECAFVYNDKSCDVAYKCLMKWYEREPEKALAYLESMSGRDMERTVLSALKNPEAALAGILAIEKATERSSALAVAVYRWGLDNPTAAEHWIENNLKGDDRNDAVVALIGAAKGNFPEVERLAATLPEGRRLQAFDRYFMDAFARNPGGAVDDLLSVQIFSRAVAEEGLSKLSDVESVTAAETCRKALLRGENVNKLLGMLQKAIEVVDTF